MSDPFVNQLTGEVVEFTKWPKIQRAQRAGMVITEKLDGTNAAIRITADGVLLPQSRSRFIQPGKQDNAGFAAWVQEHELELEALGEGIHFGEWWGKGIQRGYGLEEKRFSLFNTSRWNCWHNGGVGFPEHWNDGRTWYATQCYEVPCCHVVPVLYRGALNMPVAEGYYNLLKRNGSVAAFGFDNPEGVVIRESITGTMWKWSDAKAPPAERV